MKIAICTDQFPPYQGGVSEVARLQLEGLTALGHEVRVFAPRLSGAHPDTRVVRIPTAVFAGRIGIIVSPFGITRRLRDFNPDVVHMHSIGILAVAASAAARRLKKPRIITYHGAMADYLHVIRMDYSPIRRAVTYACDCYFDRCDILTAPSHRALALLKSEGVKRPMLEYVPNPIDLGLFIRSPDKDAAKRRHGVAKRAIMIFGRMSPEKNLAEAVAVFERVARKSDAQLVFIGDGPARVDIESLVREHGLSARVRFLGYVSGQMLADAVNACDIMLTTSLTEVQPLSILQAHACGIPVVGTDAGGVPDCIRDGENGYIVTPHAIDAYAERCLRLLADDALRARLADIAVKDGITYAPRTIASEYARLYMRLQKS